VIGLLAGAGFSKWAAGLPLAKDLFDFNIEPFGEKEAEKLRQVKRLKEEWDRRNPDNAAEAFIADSMAGTSLETDVVLWYIVRRLSEPYIWQEWHAGKNRRHVLMIDENRKYDRPGVKEARDFLMGTSNNQRLKTKSPFLQVSDQFSVLPY
jgi:hypothetical protein